jgi:hypothetical protein
MRQVVHPIQQQQCISIDQCDQRRLIVMRNGVVGIVIYRDHAWSVVYSNGTVSKDYITLALLFNTLPDDVKMFEV